MVEYINAFLMKDNGFWIEKEPFESLKIDILWGSKGIGQVYTDVF